MSEERGFAINEIMKLFSILEMNHFKLKTEDFELEMTKESTNVLEPKLPTPKTVEKPEEYPTKEMTAETEKAEEDEGIHIITSPIPGTFYRSPAPGEETFVEIGDKVKIGDVLCIVEAMKVMNKIESEISGEIVDFLIEDSHTVEYGTQLIKIKQF